MLYRLHQWILLFAWNRLLISHLLDQVSSMVYGWLCSYFAVSKKHIMIAIQILHPRRPPLRQLLQEFRTFRERDSPITLGLMKCNNSRIWTFFFLKDVKKCLDALDEISTLQVTTQHLQKQSELIATLKKARRTAPAKTCGPDLLRHISCGPDPQV